MEKLMENRQASKNQKLNGSSSNNASQNKETIAESVGLGMNGPLNQRNVSCFGDGPGSSVEEGTAENRNSFANQFDEVGEMSRSSTVSKDQTGQSQTQKSRERLLEWLKVSQAKRDENNRQVFTRWIDRYETATRIATEQAVLAANSTPIPSIAPGLVHATAAGPSIIGIPPMQAPHTIIMSTPFMQPVFPTQQMANGLVTPTFVIENAMSDLNLSSVGPPCQQPADTADTSVAPVAARLSAAPLVVLPPSQCVDLGMMQQNASRGGATKTGQMVLADPSNMKLHDRNKTPTGEVKSMHREAALHPNFGGGDPSLTTNQIGDYTNGNLNHTKQSNEVSQQAMEEKFPLLDIQQTGGASPVGQAAKVNCWSRQSVPPPNQQQTTTPAGEAQTTKMSPDATDSLHMGVSSEERRLNNNDCHQASAGALFNQAFLGASPPMAYQLIYSPAGGSATYSQQPQVCLPHPGGGVEHPHQPPPPQPFYYAYVPTYATASSTGTALTYSGTPQQPVGCIPPKTAYSPVSSTGLVSNSCNGSRKVIGTNYEYGQPLLTTSYQTKPGMGTANASSYSYATTTSAPLHTTHGLTNNYQSGPVVMLGIQPPTNQLMHATSIGSPCSLAAKPQLSINQQMLHPQPVSFDPQQQASYVAVGQSVICPTALNQFKNAPGFPSSPAASYQQVSSPSSSCAIQSQPVHLQVDGLTNNAIPPLNCGSTSDDLSAINTNNTNNSTLQLSSQQQSPAGGNFPAQQCFYAMQSVSQSSLPVDSAIGSKLELAAKTVQTTIPTTASFSSTHVRLHLDNSNMAELSGAGALTSEPTSGEVSAPVPPLFGGSSDVAVGDDEALVNNASPGVELVQQPTDNKMIGPTGDTSEALSPCGGEESSEMSCSEAITAQPDGDGTVEASNVRTTGSRRLKPSARKQRGEESTKDTVKNSLEKKTTGEPVTTESNNAVPEIVASSGKQKTTAK